MKRYALISTTAIIALSTAIAFHPAIAQQGVDVSRQIAEMASGSKMPTPEDLQKTFEANREAISADAMTPPASQEAAAPAQPELRAPMPNQSHIDGLGNHIATRVLNMNGYNITNLNDPIFDGDAVSLGYLKNNGSLGSHKATKDLDLSGFGLLNVKSLNMNNGEISLANVNNSTILNSVAASMAITRSTLTDSTMSKSTVEFSEINNSIGKSLEISGSKLTDSNISGSEIEKSGFKDGTIETAIIKDSVIEGGQISGATLVDVILEGVSLPDLDLEAVKVNASEITNSTVTGGSIDGSSLINVTLGTSKISEAEVTGSSFSDGSLQNVKISGAIEIGPSNMMSPTISGGANLSDSKITNLADGDADLDAANIRTVRKIAEEIAASAIANMPEPKAPEPVVQIEKSLPDCVTVALADDGKTTNFVVSMAGSGLDYMIADRAGKLSKSMSMEPGSGVTLFNAGRPRVVTTRAGATIMGDLSVSGVVSGAVSEFRPTPVARQTLGTIVGDDVMKSLRKISSTIYKLPSGDYAAGIAPETVPPELAFIAKLEETSGKYAVDYDQMIGPMLAAIQLMDARIQALEEDQARRGLK